MAIVKLLCAAIVVYVCAAEIIQWINEAIPEHLQERCIFTEEIRKSLGSVSGESNLSRLQQEVDEFVAEKHNPYGRHYRLLKLDDILYLCEEPLPMHWWNSDTRALIIVQDVRSGTRIVKGINRSTSLESQITPEIKKSIEALERQYHEQTKKDRSEGIPSTVK